MPKKPPKIHSLKPRPEKGRLLFYTRDSGGEHETTLPQYVRNAIRFADSHSLQFSGKPETILRMASQQVCAEADLFLDWGVAGNQLERPGLTALIAEVARDASVSHVVVPRSDRLVRPDKIHEGMILEDKFRRELGVTLVLGDRILRPLKRGEKLELSDYLQSAVAHDRANEERRTLSQKSIHSQISRAINGYASGGRPMYGLERWLVDPDNAPVRKLDDKESVHRPGFHVLWLPATNGTYEIRLRIKKMLKSMPASVVAATLTQEGIPSPDAGRLRRDGGVLHPVSGVWHATTITNIGRDAIDAGNKSYGKKSSGDCFRFSTEGPRMLEDGDFDQQGKPRVIHNSPDSLINGPVYFEPRITADSQAELTAILDKRAGTQRNKPRSRSPELNPLGGGRIIDLDCAWPMYRQPYNGSFRYTCGLYQQSHGAKCEHNHVDGPTATRFLRSCLRQKLHAAGASKKLCNKLEALYTQNQNEHTAQSIVQKLQNTLAKLDAELRLVSQNMARAKNDEQFQQISNAFDQLNVERSLVQARLDKCQSPALKSIHSDEIQKAMDLLKYITELASQETFAAAHELFKTVDARIFAKFKSVTLRTRTVRKLVSGTVTFGDGRFPVLPYSGPTDRKSVQAKTTTATSSVAVVGDSQSPGLLFPQEPPQEGNSFGNPHRGDWHGFETIFEELATAATDAAS